MLRLATADRNRNQPSFGVIIEINNNGVNYGQLIL